MTSGTLSPDLVDIIQAIVRAELDKIRMTDVGIVTKLYPHESGSDKNNYECDVKLRDSGMELPRVQVATQRIGMAAIPNVDDMVLVQFIGGDPYGAVITGRLYNDQDRPPEAKAKEFVYVSRDDAESGVRRVWMEFPNGNTLLLDDDKVVLEVGKTKLSIKNSGDVELTSEAKVVVTSKGNAEISSDGDISLESGGNLTIKAQGDLKLEGMTFSAKGQSSAQLEGQASTTVKGPTISIAGMTSFSPG